MEEISRSPNTVRARLWGIGVALIIKRFGSKVKLPTVCRPFSIIAWRCKTPKRCCSSITASSISLYSTFEEKSAWVPTIISISPSLSARSSWFRPFARRFPVRKAVRTPRGDSRRAVVSACCRARISVGAIKAHCPFQLIILRHTKRETRVLPEPTSPCKRRAIVNVGETGGGMPRSSWFKTRSRSL